VGVAAVVPSDPRTSATRWIQNPQQEQGLALLVTWLVRAAPRGPDGYALRVLRGAALAASAALRAALAAGNPLNMNQLQGRFRLTRNEATQARRDGAWCQEPKSSDPGRRPTGSLTTSPPRQRPASSRYRYWRPFMRDPKLSRTPA
jgi:hypothetical protein